MADNVFLGNEMKWICTLILAAMMVATVCAKERHKFPFDQATRITFIRLGNIKADGGPQFVLADKQGQWTIERRLSRTYASAEDISTERADEFLTAFSELYSYWQDTPYRDSKKKGYSLYIAINDTWQMNLRVKDRGSPELNRLIELIEYPDGMDLKKVKEGEASEDGAKSNAQP